MAHFPDFHKTVLNSGKWLYDASRKSSVQIREMYEPLGRGELHSVAFQIAWQIQNVLVLSSKKKLFINVPYHGGGRRK
jgi:hypothetical protein